MTFHELSEYFSRIEKVTSRLEMTRILSELFKKLGKHEIEKALYLLQGRVAAQFEMVDFGMGEKMLRKAILSATGVDNKVFAKEYRELGDLGVLVEKLRQHMHTIHQKDLSISEVFSKLSATAQASGDGSQEVKIGTIADLIQNLDALSCRYLLRIPTQTLRLGFSDMTILDGFSWMLSGDKSLRGAIEKAYHVRPDIGFIGRLIKEKGIEGLKKVTPKLFTPILMMRAERLSDAKEIIKKIGTCSVEPKYDGFRLQAHYQKGKVKLFSRSLDEVSFMYPDIVEGITRQIVAREAIFEGEAIGYVPKTGEFLPFQQTVKRKRKYDIVSTAQEIPLKLFVFDLLYKDGEIVFALPFITRRKMLSQSFSHKHKARDTVVVADDRVIETPEALDALFEEDIARGLEGIIAKKRDGVYQAGGRGFNWIKYKKSYSSSLQDTIDCLIMGYDTGKGKRTGFGIGAFLVGVYDVKKDQFATVAKIGTGLTDDEWRSLKKMIDTKHLISESSPALYQIDKNLICDVWVKPRLVVEIRADEITHSPVHTAGRVMRATKTGKGEEVEIPGFALRFPRLERFRDDKRPEDVTTLKELTNLYHQQRPT